MSKNRSLPPSELEQPGKTTGLPAPSIGPPSSSDQPSPSSDQPPQLAPIDKGQLSSPAAIHEGSPRPLLVLDFKDAKALPLKMAAFITANRDTVVRTYLTDDFDGQVIEEKHALDGESPTNAEMNVPLHIVSVSARYGVGIDEDQEVFESVFTTIELASGKILRLSGNPACDSLLPRIATNMSGGKSLRDNPIIMKLVKRNSKSSSKNSYYWFERPTKEEIAAVKIDDGIPPVPDTPF